MAIARAIVIGHSPPPAGTRPAGIQDHFDGRNSDRRNNTIGKQLQVFVRDNNVDQALKVLKKKMQREGVFREMKLRSHYEKPSEKRVREKAEAVRRARKLARKKLQREGLLPMKPRVVPGAPGRGGPARAPFLISQRHNKARVCAIRLCERQGLLP